MGGSGNYGKHIRVLCEVCVLLISVYASLDVLDVVALCLLGVAQLQHSLWRVLNQQHVNNTTSCKTTNTTSGKVPPLIPVSQS